MAANDVAVYAFEVGQGSSAAIISRIPGRKKKSYQASVIDVGVSGARLATMLKSQFGVERIPTIVLTHNHDDHVFGLAKLIEAYAPHPSDPPKVGKVWFLRDCKDAEPSCWMPVQNWRAEGKIRGYARLEAPAESVPGLGQNLVTPAEVGYSLYCIYPNFTQNEAVVRDAPQLGAPLGHTQNDTSAVLRLTRTERSEETVVLFGGDLGYKGWRQLNETHDLSTPVLVAPHHGGARGETVAFGHDDLAQAVKPKHVLFSVGTNQRHVTPGTEKTARHPLEIVVKAFRAVNAIVLCTQLTDRCHDHPDKYPKKTVLPLIAGEPDLDLSPSGTACAGTIVVTIPAKGDPVVRRVAEHQLAVDGLVPKHHPICRP